MLEQKYNEEQKADGSFVSQPIAKPHVVCSQSHVNSLEEMSKIWLSKEYLEKRKCFFDSFFDEQFKRLEQDNLTP